MKKRPRILFVAMPDCVHAIRWISQLRDQDWDLHLFPTLSARPLPGLPADVEFHDCLRDKIDRHVKMTVLLPMHVRGAYRLSRLVRKLRAVRCQAASPARRPVPDIFPIEPARVRRLASLIRKIKPDIVHSLMIPNSGYLALAARESMGADFPAWIVQNWGNDIYLFGRLEGHESVVRAVLSACDYYDCECERDVQIARDYGFKGKILPVLPNAGGYDLVRMRGLRQPGLTSERRMILLKGYQHWQGRALVALRAIELAADALAGYRVAIFRGVTSDVRVSAELVSRGTGIPIEFIEPVPQDEMLKLHGRSRISMGLNISDGISISILEAMMMGSFPIQSGTGCACDWYEDGKSGFIVPPEDPGPVAAAIRRAVTDDALVDRAAEINWQTAVERLDQKVITPKVVQAYESILTTLQ